MRLSNPKHENLAQLLAKEISISEAYARSGFRPDTGNASRLANSPSIRQRIAELRAGRPADIDLAEVDAPSIEAAVDALWVEAKRSGPTAVSALKTLVEHYQKSPKSGAGVDEQLTLAIAEHSESREIEDLLNQMVKYGVADVRIEEAPASRSGDPSGWCLRVYSRDGELKRHRVVGNPNLLFTPTNREAAIAAHPPLVKGLDGQTEEDGGPQLAIC
jgi:hypothetical protein